MQRGCQGTPPPTRGKYVTSSVDVTTTGNTPAYAGKIQIIPSNTLIQGEHPRLRGENARASITVQI